MFGEHAMLWCVSPGVGVGGLLQQTRREMQEAVSWPWCVCCVPWRVERKYDAVFCSVYVGFFLLLCVAFDRGTHVVFLVLLCHGVAGNCGGVSLSRMYVLILPTWSGCIFLFRICRVCSGLLRFSHNEHIVCLTIMQYGASRAAAGSARPKVLKSPVVELRPL